MYLLGIKFLLHYTRSWDRGIPGTRAVARVAAHCTPSTAF